MAADDERIVAPTLRPTRLQFERPFVDYVGEQFQRHPEWGCFKVVPPPGWKPTRDVRKKLENIRIQTPIRQHVSGRGGAYQCMFLEQNSIMAVDFERWATSSARSPPLPGRREDELMERTFWSSLTVRPPLYGADTPVSLFDERLAFGWNLRSLGDLLHRPGVPEVCGVTTPMAYFGSWKSFFGWHKEDLDLYSINYNHLGAPKVWYCVSPADQGALEAALRSLFPPLAAACPSFARHKDLVVSPASLRAHGVRFTTCIQRPGEFVVINAGAYHSGYNLGFNVAEAVNFALPDWLPVGRHADVCTCGALQDPVSIDVKRLFKDVARARHERRAKARARKATKKRRNDDQHQTPTPGRGAAQSQTPTPGRGAAQSQTPTPGRGARDGDAGAVSVDAEEDARTRAGASSARKRARTGASEDDAADDLQAGIKVEAETKVGAGTRGGSQRPTPATRASARMAARAAAAAAAAAAAEAAAEAASESDGSSPASASSDAEDDSSDWNSSDWATSSSSSSSDDDGDEDGDDEERKDAKRERNDGRGNRKAGSGPGPRAAGKAGSSPGWAGRGSRTAAALPATTKVTRFPPGKGARSAANSPPPPAKGKKRAGADWGPEGDVDAPPGPPPAPSLPAARRASGARASTSGRAPDAERRGASPPRISAQELALLSSMPLAPDAAWSGGERGALAAPGGLHGVDVAEPRGGQRGALAAPGGFEGIGAATPGGFEGIGAVAPGGFPGSAATAPWGFGGGVDAAERHPGRRVDVVAPGTGARKVESGAEPGPGRRADGGAWSFLSALTARFMAELSARTPEGAAAPGTAHRGLRPGDAPTGRLGGPGPGAAPPFAALEAELRRSSHLASSPSSSASGEGAATPRTRARGASGASSLPAPRARARGASDASSLPSPRARARGSGARLATWAPPAPPSPASSGPARCGPLVRFFSTAEETQRQRCLRIAIRTSRVSAERARGLPPLPPVAPYGEADGADPDRWHPAWPALPATLPPVALVLDDPSELPPDLTEAPFALLQPLACVLRDPALASWLVAGVMRRNAHGIWRADGRVAILESTDRRGLAIIPVRTRKVKVRAKRDGYRLEAHGKTILAAARRLAAERK